MRMRLMAPRNSRASSRRVAVAMFAAGLAVGLAGCESMQPVEPTTTLITDPAQFYKRLVLNYPAVNLSTAPSYRTVQLVATPHDATDSPMPNLPAPTYVSLDTNRVKVAGDGTLTAVGVGNGIKVVATLTAGLVTRTDTAYVNVTGAANPTVPDTLSIEPLTGTPDSATWSLTISLEANNLSNIIWYFAGLTTVNPFVGPQVVARAKSATGSNIPISGLQVAYTSLDPAIATLNRRTGVGKVIRTGQARFVAETYAYGVARADTVVYTMTPPMGWLFNVGLPSTFTPKITLRPNAIVIWYTDGPAADVTFDDPTNVAAVSQDICDLAFAILDPSPVECGSGQVVVPPAIGEDPASQVGQVRQFPVPGTYTYHTVVQGTAITGQIVISNSID